MLLLWGPQPLASAPADFSTIGVTMLAGLGQQLVEGRVVIEAQLPSRATAMVVSSPGLVTRVWTEVDPPGSTPVRWGQALAP